MVRPFVLFVALLLPLVAADSITVGSQAYDLAHLRVDNPRIEVTELPQYAAVLFNFSLHSHDGARRRPLVGLRRGDFTIQLADEGRELSSTESSFDVLAVEGQAEPGALLRFRPTLVRYITLMLDMSDSMFKVDGRLQLTRNAVRALLGGLAEAQLPGVLVAVYGFADVDSLQVVCNFTADISAVRRAVEEELALTREQRVVKYGVSTNLYLSVFSLLEILEGTLRSSSAQTSLANLFVLTDGHDETRLVTTEAFNLRLGRYYQGWLQAGLDLVLQPVLLSAADASHPLARVQFNGERIDGRSSSQATLAFEKFVVDVSQDTPASYYVLVCETARDSAPRQRRDLILQGHRLFSYDFSPAGFRREGAARCDSSALLARFAQQGVEEPVRPSGLLDEL